MNHRVLICGPEGSGRRTLFHALGGVVPRSSPSVFVDAFKRSLGDLRGVSGHIWVQLVHGGDEVERAARERDLIAVSDAVILLCDARAERFDANLHVVSQVRGRKPFVAAISHARDAVTAERLATSLGIDPGRSLRIGANDPLGALAVMKTAARACATVPARELIWRPPSIGQFQLNGET